MTIDHREVKSKLRINLKINEDNSCCLLYTSPSPRD